MSSDAAYAIGASLEALARQGAADMGVSSCATRHGEAECHCVPADHALLMCATCDDFTAHRYAGEVGRGHYTRNRVEELFEELFECKACGCRRRYGLTVSARG